MKFFTRTAGYILFDHRRKKEILEELKLEPDDEKLRRYKSNKLRHVIRMSNNRMPKLMLNYRPVDEDDLEELRRCRNRSMKV